MRQRLSGESKKGRNLAYGLRYARVIANTYLRERRAADKAQSALLQQAAETGTADS
jgi:hypothetical protein